MENIHYDTEFVRKRDLLPEIIKNELTARQRSVIGGYYLRQATTKEIAEDLGITTSAVLRLRKRAEGRIAKYLRYA